MPLALATALALLAPTPSQQAYVETLGGGSAGFASQPRLAIDGAPLVGADRHDAPASVLVSGEAYFAHSYGLVEVPQGWRAAWSDCGERFVSAI